MHENQYNYGLDILKIISMLQVMILHILNHGGILLVIDSDFSINYAGVWLLEIISYCAVNVFVLISGYVGSIKKTSYGNGLLVWIETLWYSVGIYVVFLFLGRTFNLREFYHCCTPVLNDQYWYISSYMGMILLSPILNEIINLLDAKTLGLYAWIALVICSLLSCLDPNVFNINSGYSTIWFVFLYLTGGAVRKNDLHIKIKKYCFILWGGDCPKTNKLMN